MSEQSRYRSVVAALITAGTAGLSLALAGPAEAKGTEGDTARPTPTTDTLPVATRLQAIRDAVSAVDPSAIPTGGLHGAIADRDIKLAWWLNENGRGWGNGGRGWGNGGGPRWGNGNWHNWHNGGRFWGNY